MADRKTLENIKSYVLGTADTGLGEMRLVEELGVDSLGMMELIADLEDELDVSLAVNHLYTIQTPEAMRQYLAAHHGEVMA